MADSEAGDGPAIPSQAETLKASEVVYVLTETEQDSVCGDFGGTIIYADGYSVDARVARFPTPRRRTTRPSPATTRSQAPVTAPWAR